VTENDTSEHDFSGLKAVIFNGTLTISPAPSHTDLLIKISTDIMEKHGVKTEIIRTIDHPDIATGVYPDMHEHGWENDEWPELYAKVRAADIIILAGPIWLGDNSSMTKKIIERLYACSSELNEQGQYAYYGKVGGCLITGNEDGVKHCAQNILYSLQHLGCTIPPQADAGWIGEAGPGASYGDDDGKGGRVGLDNDFTNRNTTFMTWNLMHLAKMLQTQGGVPPYGNQRTKWDAGARFDFQNPEYR
jgi:multimeric flavodoxin WrbA